MDGARDVVDAKGFFGKSKNDPGVMLPGSSENFDYSMNFPNRGKCYIFNNKTFERNTQLNVRNGTDVDASRLYVRFRELGFEVYMFQDYRVKDIEKELQKAGKEDHTKNSCFVCCILSHGEHGILYGADGKYQTEHVFAPFRGDACPSLAGKPKIFFIQACQGDKLDSGVPVTYIESKESTDSDTPSTFRIPTHADFLIVYSTVSGFYSWRNTTNGSWFIQALCDSLQKYIKDKDLLQVLTIASRRVAYDFESFTPQDPYMHMKKQVPCVTSTLTRNVRFPVPLS